MMQRLEEEGIKTYLKDEHTVTIDPILSNVLGGIKLMVYESQVERAMELIRGFEQLYREAGACPLCHSTNVQYISDVKDMTSWFTAILTWLFGNYAVSSKNVYHCFDCGHDFTELPYH